MAENDLPNPDGLEGSVITAPPAYALTLAFGRVRPWETDDHA